jgi:carbamoyl-phosphate synthase small subunit
VILGKLVLEDGKVFSGRRCGFVDAVAVGEVVFNTAMSGYQEVLTDPSYTEQMVVMTAPMIGNTGMAADDAESNVSGAPPGSRGAAALLMKELSRVASSWRSQQPLPDYLLEHRLVGLSEVDTRSVVQHLRQHGSRRGAIVDAGESVEAAVALAKEVELGRNLAAQASCQQAYTWDAGHPSVTGDPVERRDLGLQVVVLDLGVKHNILRSLVDAGCRVRVVPATTSAADILALRPDGVVVSNGPGDPASLPSQVKTVQQLLGKVPLFGICMGHQLLGLALGGSRFKLKFGHHGANHPVQDLANKKVWITSQNHGYGIDLSSLPTAKVVPTHLNLTDQTLAGFAVPGAQAFAVQFHPEGGPGPHDARPLFEQFVAQMQDPTPHA